MPEAWLGFGGNLGDVRQTLSNAVSTFCDGDAVHLLARSSDYRTPPWGRTDQPAFINLCIAVATRLSPFELLERGLSVERAFGRERKAGEMWGARTLDIDILSYEGITLDSSELKIPHPHALERAFVLVPLAEIRPSGTIAGVSIQGALTRLDTSGIVKLPPLTEGPNPV